MDEGTSGNSIELIGNLILLELKSIRREMKEEIKKLGDKFEYLIGLNSTNHGAKSYLNQLNHINPVSNHNDTITNGQISVATDVKEGVVIPTSENKMSPGISEFIDDLAGTQTVNIKEEFTSNISDEAHGKKKFNSESDLSIHSPLQSPVNLSNCSQRSFSLLERYPGDTKLKQKSRRKNPTPKIVCSSSIALEDGDVTYKCDVCKLPFDEWSLLVAHTELHKHEEQDYLQSEEKSVDSLKSVDVKSGHETPENNESAVDNPIKYHSCNQSVVEMRNLKDHSSEHCNEPLLGCQECGMRFHLETQLKFHQYVHRDSSKQFQCKICHKRLVSFSNLKLHMKIHTGEKAYVCNLCKKSFVFPNDLTRHVRTHTGEKPYQCKLCDKKFSRRDNLKLHEYIHTRNPKPYPCSACDKSFTCPRYLLRHYTKSHGDKNVVDMPLPEQHANSSITRL